MRNIVLITLDSVRADHCSFMGYHRKTTPTLDWMARKGLYFKNAITSGVGTPTSMVGVFTGDYSYIDSEETKFEPWRCELAQRRTLAQVLLENGYSTGAIHPNVFVSHYYGFNKGFVYFYDFLSENKNMLSRLTMKFRRFSRGKLSILRNLINLMQKEEVFKPWESYYDLIIDWVERAEKPFFLWVLLLDTHHPYIAPKKFRKGSFLDNVDLILFSRRGQKANWKLNLSEKERRKLIDAYDDSIFYADSFIKKLWGDLKSDDPIFIVHADHGEGFGEHGFYSHPPYLYEEFIHVPLIIYNADIKGKIEAPVSLLGIAPTILELIGKQNEFIFESILRVRKSWVISKVFKGGKRRLAVRMKNWKFIVGQKDVEELYYLKQDPYEQENLINKHPELAKEMKEIAKIHIKYEMITTKICDKISKIKKVRKI